MQNIWEQTGFISVHPAHFKRLLSLLCFLFDLPIYPIGKTIYTFAPKPVIVSRFGTSALHYNIYTFMSSLAPDLCSPFSCHSMVLASEEIQIRNQYTKPELSSCVSACLCFALAGNLFDIYGLWSWMAKSLICIYY